MERVTRFVAGVLSCALLSSSSALAADWPQWRGPNRDGHVPAGDAVPAKLSGIKVVWKTPAGFGLASPVVSGGRAFYLAEREGKEVVYAVDAATGAATWDVELDETFKDSQSAAGPRATPVVDGERVFAQSSRGHLKCLAAADGKLLWETNYVKDLGATFTGEKGPAEGSTRHGYTGAPLVDGGHLIAMPGGKDACVVCFDKASGKVIWKSQPDTPAYAAPVIADVLGTRQFIAFTVQGVIALDPDDGRLLWRVPVKTSLGRHVTTPVVVGGDTVLVASHQVGLIGIKVSREGQGGFRAAPAWTNKDAAINFSSPVAVGRHLYGVGPAKNFICIDTADGKLAWSHEGLFSSAGGKAHAGILVLDGADKLLVLTDSGELALVAADPAECRVLGKAQACGQNWCIPAWAGGRLFVRDAKEVRCLQFAD